MVSTANFLAVDIGAESGRCMLGSFDGECIGLREIHRFNNSPIRLLDRLHWDVLRLFTEVKNGLAKSVQECGSGLTGFGLDTWGVDFALLDEQGELLGNPYHYRDNQTKGMLEEAFRRMPREEIYQQTGIQFMRLNSLYQLLALEARKSPLLFTAKTFLMVPDLFNYWFTGQKVCEYTDASTSQCLDAVTRDWAWSLLDRMNIPTHIFPQIIQPGSVLGELLPSIAEEIGAKGLPVIATATHDNASALASISRESEGYLSSGTWSVVGTELIEPIINDITLRFNFTNEGGVCGTISLFKNIMGLWLIQECRRTWSLEGDNLSYNEISQLAAGAPAFAAVIDPDSTEFLTPGDMPARIRDYCRRTGQKVPDTPGAIARTIFESLALKYRWVFERLEQILERHLDTLQIIGGGSQNRLQNQFVANAINRPVIAGPFEATTIGNLLMQMLALGFVSSLEEGRQLVKCSFQTETYLPQETGSWDEAYPRLINQIGSVMLG